MKRVSEIPVVYEIQLNFSTTATTQRFGHCREVVVMSWEGIDFRI